MRSERALELISSGHGLLEGPIWHPTRGLLVADADVGGVWAFAPDAVPELVVPHRRGIGGMALHENGGIVVSGRNVAFKRLLPEGDGERTAVLLANDPSNGSIGFNDLTPDSAGRLYVGSLGFLPAEGIGENPRPGFLHCIDIDGSVRVVANDVLLTNGLAFSPHGRRLYHSDSVRRMVKVYVVAEDGSLGPPQAFAQVDHGLPDGLAVAEDGSVWVALAHGDAVVRFTPDGTEAERLPVPVPMVTSVCFGGNDLRDLWIVTGSSGAPAALRACVYRMRVDVPGLRRPLVRVPIRNA